MEEAEIIGDDNSTKFVESKNVKNSSDVDKFEKIIIDFINDLKTSFPEFNDKLLINFDDNNNLKRDYIFEHCKKVYPERFFDFLYKNEEIIENSDINTEILPCLDLKDLWKKDGVTESIKETIWKYIQLIMFSVIGDIEDKNIFGNTSKLFEAIGEKELKNKMEETMSDLFNLFNQTNEDDNDSTNEDDNNDCENDGENDGENNNTEKPEFLNPENVQEHISSLLDGKLGKLATEIAEETAKEFNIDVNDENTNQDVMKKLFTNPTQLMNLIKKVGGKLDSKIKSGDIKESELMAEANELMKKMGGMGGMKDINKLFKNMGIPPGSIPGLGKNTKLNMGAFNNKMRKQEAMEKLLQLNDKNNYA